MFLRIIKLWSGMRLGNKLRIDMIPLLTPDIKSLWYTPDPSWLPRDLVLTCILPHVPLIVDGRNKLLDKAQWFSSCKVIFRVPFVSFFFLLHGRPLYLSPTNLSMTVFCGILFGSSYVMWPNHFNTGITPNIGELSRDWVCIYRKYITRADMFMDN